MNFINRLIRAIKIRSSNFLNRKLAFIHTIYFNLFARNNNREIAEYRKKIKVYDVFSFFNELDILEIRLNILNDYVDYFVIIESTKTFSGLKKPLFYKENIQRFTRWQHKIIYKVIDDMPESTDELKKRLVNTNTTSVQKKIIYNTLKTKNIPPNSPHWLRDFYQKEYAQIALDGINDNDICFICDVDEIWNPKTIIDYKEDYIYKLEQKVYTYYLNNRSDEYWDFPYVTKYKNLKNNCINHYRSDPDLKFIYVKNGGWHFTNQGNFEKMREKLESYSHQEFNTKDIKDKLEKRMRENKDFAGRKSKFWTEEKDLPDYLIENKDKYKELFK